MPSSKVPGNVDGCAEENTLRTKPVYHNQIGESRTFFFGISSSYIQDWDRAAAFREIYQNWRDAILARFSLSRLDFQPVYEDRGDCIAIVVPDPSDRDRQDRALGFIKYDKHSGCVTISNCCADIGLNVLELGYSSKRRDSNAAGCHGEGLKLAALVMLRSGLNVDLFASRNHWQFGLLKSHFYCEIKPSGQNGFVGRNPAEDMFRLSASADRDVTLEIRAPLESKTSTLSWDDFHSWLAMTFDIRGLSHPSDILETEAGDLILDPKFHGRIYLNGMRLPCSGSELKQYRFAYNFLHGKVNRDRQILVDRDEEANMVRQIWEAAIRKHRVAFLPIYVNLLRNFPKALDVESAAHFLEPPTKHLIWKYLLGEAGDDKFYYNETSSAESIATIQEILERQPIKLPESLWTLLRSDSPIRTPEEEQIEYFKNAEVCSIPETSYARTVHRAFMACVTVLIQGRTIEVQYVRAKRSAIQALYNTHRRVLKVAHQWLDFAGSHGPVLCRETLFSKVGGQSFFCNHVDFRDNVLFCDHIVEELLKFCLVPLLGRSAAFKTTEVMILRKIRRLLRHMPHTITVSRSFLAGALKITWEDNETESFRKRSMHDPPYHVVLHEEKCSSARADLIHGDAVDCAVDRAPCGCPQQFVSQKIKTAVFENLQSSKRYYAMISLNRSQAIYGFPPRPKQPVLPNLRVVDDNSSHGVRQPHEENSHSWAVSLQPPDPAIIALNTAHRRGGLNHHDQEPSLPVKRHFSDEPDSKKADCKKLKISQLVEGPTLD